MKKYRLKLLLAGVLSFMLILSGCGGDSGTTTTVGAVGTGNGTETGVVNDDGIDTGIAATATTVAGKVTLSSIVSAKARAKAALNEALRYGKPGSAAYNKVMQKAANLQKAIDQRLITSYSADVAFSQGKVYLYNSSRPSWLYPVAEAATDSDGVYTLETLINADKNLNADGTAAYVDGTKIPGGNYTLLAFTEKDYGLFKLPDLVALQSVVSEFSGTVPGIDLEASQSTASPKVTTMLGVPKNTDGTQTWGDNTLELAPNAALQISFSMPMYRTAVSDNFLLIESTDGGRVPAGLWTLSADWLTATYYPKADENWEPGKTYTVTVKGSDSDAGVAIYNIFGRFLELSGVGTFKILELEAGEVLADLIDGKKPNVTISSPKFGALNNVPVITPMRIVADERMDVNGLRVKAKPSLGAQPGVLFVGKTSDNLYEYEFLLGDPLKLGTDYTVTVSGGQDLAGNKMDDYKVSFTTEETSEGIPAIDASLTGTELETAVKKINNQTDVKDVFGKWVRAFNDRNLPQLQNVMTSEFKMEYNATGGYNVADINRDAALDLQEFAVDMADTFIKWNYCDIKMTAKIVGNINVDVIAKEADFAFTLTAEAGDKSPECKQAAIDQKLFANLEKVNGAWLISKASEGVDNREQVAVVLKGLALLAPDDASTPAFFDPATETETDVPFKWTSVTDASAYIWMVFDSRKPSSGLALILPADMTSINIPSDIEALLKAKKVADVAKAFGFTDRFDPRDGSHLFWQVAALGSYTVSDVSNDRAPNLASDVVAKSELWNFTIPGTFEMLNYRVLPNSSSLQSNHNEFDGTDGSPAKFSEFIDGFDVGEANFATITFNTSDENILKGFVQIEGVTRIEKVVDFVDGEATVTLPLNNGINVVMISNGVPCWKNNTCRDDRDVDNEGLEEWFQIHTTGGIKAIIFFGDEAGSSGITTVNAAGETADVASNNWDWYESTDAVSLTLVGKVNLDASALNGTVPEDVRIDVGSETGARATMKVDVDSGTGAFSADIQVFKGDNWISVTTSICNVTLATDQKCEQWQRREFRDQFGLRTDAGSEYTPPISGVVVTHAEDDTVVERKEDWGDGGRWDASGVTGNQVIISGVLDVTTGEARYSVGSDGGWVDDKLSVGPDGRFNFTVDLFKGENQIGIRDAGDNGYHLSIFTSLGKAVIRPELTEILGADGEVISYSGGDLFTDQCSITLKGTAMEGNVEASWNGQKDVEIAESGDRMIEWYGENIRTETVESEGVHVFSVTLPLVGDPTSGDEPPGVWSENWIEVFDANWNRLGLRVISTGNCDYVTPELKVTSVKDAEGNTLAKISDWGNGGEYGVLYRSASAKASGDSAGLTVTEPQKNATVGGDVVVTGKLDFSKLSWTDASILRILVNAPEVDEPIFMATSRSDDPFFNEMGDEMSRLSLNPDTGQFSTTVNIALSQPHIIEVLVWDDMNETDAEPVAEYQIPINGAKLPDDSSDHVGASDDEFDRDAEGYTDGNPDGEPHGVTTDTISIEGTTNVKAGKVMVELEGCGGVERYTVVAEDTDTDGDGWYNWATAADDSVIVYNGRNHLQVRNGPMEYRIEVNAISNSELPEPALLVSVAVDGSDLTELVDANKAPKCGQSMWDAGDASAVTVSGRTTAPDGDGEWRADGQFGRFEIKNGEFSIDEVIIYDGENRFELNDTRWNRHELMIETSGGSVRPQYVTVSDLSNLPVGSATITGTIYGQATDGEQTRFNVKDMNVDIQFGDVRYEFVTNAEELVWRKNAKVIKLVPVADSETGDYTFSFDVFVPRALNDNSSAPAAAKGQLNIWAGGEGEDGMWADHGITTGINETCNECEDNTRYWKPKR